jgi:hypothetical protein
MSLTAEEIAEKPQNIEGLEGLDESGDWYVRVRARVCRLDSIQYASVRFVACAGSWTMKTSSLALNWLAATLVSGSRGAVERRSTRHTQINTPQATHGLYLSLSLSLSLSLVLMSHEIDFMCAA